MFTYLILYTASKINVIEKQNLDSSELLRKHKILKY